jgi:hypothetical protein
MMITRKRMGTRIAGMRMLGSDEEDPPEGDVGSEDPGEIVEKAVEAPKVTFTVESGAEFVMVWV